ncbi:flagellar motor protein [Desulfolucanica intricata]|uniref:flagellar motor protein n=1 Tax=Desulfolucanica intricata TaxID=1285191 RepID=UPI00083477DB|nr:flagellar motor protein [Desulfolucanica intricata]
MDFAILVGIAVGLLGLISGFLLDGGHISVLLKPTAALIVFGGTAGATIASFSMQDLKVIPKLLKNTVFQKLPGEDEVIEQIVQLADQARREGLLYLEDRLDEIDDEFLRKGIQLIIDGTDPELVRNILETEIYTLEERNDTGASIFETAGGYAPTMGIIGTVMGLVHVLGNMSDPSTMSSSIALAFIATLYGVGSANILWLPIAGKLRNIGKKEICIKELTMEGVISLQGGYNPIIIRERLNAYLNPNRRQKDKEPEAKEEEE